MAVQYTIDGDDMSSSIQVPRGDEGVILTLTFSRAEPDSADDERRAVCDVHGQIHDRQEKLLFDHNFDEQWSAGGSLKSHLRTAHTQGDLTPLMDKLLEAHRNYVLEDLPKMMAKEDRKAAEAESMRQARLARARAWTPDQAQDRVVADAQGHYDAIARGDESEAYYLRNDMVENASANQFYDSALRTVFPDLYARAQNNQSESVTVNVAERRAQMSVPPADVSENPLNPRAVSRQDEIQAELQKLGFRMEPSLGVLDGDAHPVMVIATGEMAEDDELTPAVIELASEWSLLESPELAEEHGLDFPPARSGALVSSSPKVTEEWLGGPDELDVTTDASTLLRAAFAYVTTPEKVNVDWLCASLQEAVAKLDKAPSADAPGAGFVLAFPDGTEAEAQEILSMLRYGGNNVVRVVDPSLTTPVLDAVDWYEAMRQDDLDPSSQG